jgi:hypothetical protein
MPYCPPFLQVRATRKRVLVVIVVVVQSGGYCHDDSGRGSERVNLVVVLVKS